MGKLLGHQIRNHFKYNWFIPVLPVALIIFGLLFSNVNYSIGVNSTAIGMMALVFGYIAAAITVIVGDYNMFFGDSSLFYESIPISPSAKTFSRLLYYFVMFILYSLYVGIIFFLFATIPAVGDGGVVNITWENIMDILNQVGSKNILIGISWILVFLFNNIARIIFAISFGGGKKLRRFGFGGPVLSFILLGFIESFIINILDRFDIFTNMELYLNNGDVFINSMGVAFIFVMIVETVLFLFGVYYIHKNRISVN